MKKAISITALIILFCGFNKIGTAQNLNEKKIDKEFQGQALTSFFEYLIQTDSLNIFYNEGWINSINIQRPTRNLNIGTIIDQAINDYGLSYMVFQKENLILIPNGFMVDQDKLQEGMVGYIKVIGNLLEKGKYKENKVEGYIKYGKTGEPIAGAVIQDKQHHLATSSSYDGYYSINLPVGQTELEFSFIGLETSVIKVDVLSPGKLNVELMETSIAIEGVTITSNGGKNQVNRTQIGVETMDIKSIKKLPVLMGEADIIKSMTLLPGIQTGGEMSSGFNVRGGNVDQNLVLLNEAPVFSTAHLFGMFSTFIPSSISGVEIYKGTQTADFGGRISSVMDITLKKADTAKFRGNAGLGVLNSQAFIEGPIVKNYCSYMLGARTTYSNWIIKKVRDVKIRNSNTNFYDAIAKLDFRLSNNQRLEIFGYQSSDFFDYADITEYAYNSRLAGLNYSFIPNNRSQFKLNLASSGFNSEITSKEQESQASRLNNGIQQVRAKMEYFYNTNHHKITFGAEGNQLTVEPGEKTKYGENSGIIPSKIDKEKGMEMAGFISDNYTITDKLSLLAGVRYSWFSKMGPGTEYIYRKNAPLNDNTVIDSTVYANGQLVKPYQGIEPRLGIRYKLNNNSSVKLGYNISRQYEQLISNSASTTPADYWKLADSHIKPLVCQQVSAGYFTTLFNEFFDLSTEIYYKKSKNQLDYKPGAVLTMNPAIERSLIVGFAQSYGIELMLRKNMGDLTGWISYTLSNSLMKADGKYPEEKINNGDYYAASNHHLHDLSITVSYKLSRRWNLSSNFIYTSGRPATFPEQKYEVYGVEAVRFSERNKYRLPAYHRLDLALTYEGFLNKTRRVHPSFTFAVYNVYGHKNIYSVYYKLDTPSSLNNYNRFALYKLSIIGIPIPSLTLNLTF